ncbi:MAG: NYN domain-containing protein [Jaaginema sp. PMC 1079.18]|nr:NYN domain-containing protein [Jaaginema sp. PMC 1080.18]MEC4850448.1 NYN domain-containing protein [Jaaginema sp. PMC 1079.18]MEC4867512.1 NYN domain-containing protein [Jaaginema sp. PMC 1078.18]
MAATPARTFLLVDGYNIIGTWTHLKQVRDRHGLEMARNDLLETLLNYSAFEGYVTEVVFDAQYQNTPGYRELINPQFSVYYTAFAQTADTYIEKTCAAQCSPFKSALKRILVATSDRLHQQMVVGYGAEWLSAQQLESAVAQANHQTQRQTRPSKNSRGRLLFDSLDPQAQQRLSQWRFGIR